MLRALVPPMSKQTAAPEVIRRPRNSWATTWHAAGSPDTQLGYVPIEPAAAQCCRGLDAASGVLHVPARFVTYLIYLETARKPELPPAGTIGSRNHHTADRTIARGYLRLVNRTRPQHDAPSHALRDYFAHNRQRIGQYPAVENDHQVFPAATEGHVEEPADCERVTSKKCWS